MFARWTKPIAFGYDHQRGSYARSVPSVVAAIAQKNPLGVIGLAAFLAIRVLVFFIVVLRCWLWLECSRRCGALEAADG